ncbi:MAG TPA: M48 family metallopeptidase [Thiobacillaceae bacterium]|nr:M48 family metallopeptidase [Thiobacillaceae bacterium]
MNVPIPEFKVLLYGPGHPPAGARARARFEGDNLAIRSKDQVYLIKPGQLGLKTGGYDGRQWLLTWDSPEGALTAMLQGEEAVDAFIGLAPPAMADILERARQALGRGAWRFRLGMVLLMLILGLPLLGLGAFWLGADRLSIWATEQVSSEHEKALGDMAFSQMAKSMRLIESGAAHDAVETMGVRLVGGSMRFPFQFHLAEDDQINAFALPGGHVVVFTGLLRSLGDADELAGVLAHEISHVRARHALRGMIRSLGWRATLAVALGQYGGGIWGDMASQLGDLGYSRELEREADHDALLLLRRAGLPAEGMARFFERLAKSEKASPALLSSHPASAERLRAIRDEMGALGPYSSRSLDLDWAAVLHAVARTAPR